MDSALPEYQNGLPTFDIETVNWVEPIAVGLYDGRKYFEFIRSKEDSDPIWEFLCFLRDHYPGMKLYAHCASKFDNKFLLASLCRHGELVQIEAGLIRLRWPAYNLTFEDSYTVIPMSLRRASQVLDCLDKGTWDHTLDLKPWEMGEKLPVFKEYLKKDCMALSQVMYNLCGLLYLNFAQMPSITLPTTAAKIFDKCFYPMKTIEANERYELYIRSSIYGGRNEVYRRYGENIAMYDIKSMFVSCYDLPMPVGRLEWVKPNIEKGTLAEAKVKVPKDWYIGPLPYKLDGRLIFPVGEFSGWWDITELRHAASIGVDISLKKQLACEEAPILDGFGQFVAKLRGTKEDEFWKLFGLSLCGKMGQSRWRDCTKHITEIEDMEGWTPLDKDEVYFSKKEYAGEKQSPYIKPLVAMRVRSAARVKHHKLLLEAMGKGIIYYGDTDSVYTTAKMDTGNKVGQLVDLGIAERGYFIRQKLYGFIEKGKLKQRSAGYSDLKLTEKDFQTLLEGGDLSVEVDHLSSLRKVLQTKEIDLLERERQLRSKAYKENRVQVGLDTEPYCLPL